MKPPTCSCSCLQNGGGVYILNGQADFISCTISGNEAIRVRSADLNDRFIGYMKRSMAPMEKL